MPFHFVMHTLSDWSCTPFRVFASEINDPSFCYYFCKAKGKNRLRQIFGGNRQILNSRERHEKDKKVSEIPPMPVIIRTLGAYFCASQLYYFFNFIGSQLQYVPNGLTVRSQRTKSTLSTDKQYVPYRTEVNPLQHRSESPMAWEQIRRRHNIHNIT